MNFLIASLVLASVFITDPDTGQIVEVESGVENPTDDLYQSESEEIEEESENNEQNDRNDDVPTGAGIEVPGEETVEENLEDVPVATSSDVPDDGSGDLENQIVELLEEQVDLLSQSSLASSGNMNSQILELMDRIVNGLSSDCKYAGFRVSNTDAYRCTLYVSTKADLSGDWINFGSDCVAVDFYRYSNGSTNYLYYTTNSSPGSSVYAGGNTIVYTNVIEYSPTLGESPSRSVTFGQALAVAFFAIVLNYILQRRSAS